MSKTLYVHCEGRGFWAFDVASSVLLKFLIDAAQEPAMTEEGEWLQAVVEHWRVNAVIPDLGVYLDDNWTSSQVATVIKLLRSAAQSLRMQTSLPAGEIESWPFDDDQCLFTRGIDPVPCEPIACLAEAIIALLEDTLPAPPRGHAWFYTLDDEVQTIQMRGIVD